MKIYITIMIVAITTLIIACGNNEMSKEQAKIYQSKGSLIAHSSFTELSKNLKIAMKEGGVENAIKFCNLNAMPITKDLAEKNEAYIKRTSHLLRNPLNKPTAQEDSVINSYIELLADGEQAQQIILRDNNKINFYAPIIMKQQCLQCHGSPVRNIKPSNHILLKSLYPEDMAIGFKEGDLRGIWSISFDEKK